MAVPEFKLKLSCWKSALCNITYRRLEQGVADDVFELSRYALHLVNELLNSYLEIADTVCFMI
jgi:hypothetical protein